MKEEFKGSLLGSILLISGSCIGAGMLGLPMISALSGFIPSLFMFMLSWLFMVLTGLLLLEVALNFDSDVNLISMAGKTVGPIGKIVSAFSFIFLFFALMVAYASGSGQLVSDFALSFGLNLSPTLGSALFVFLFGLAVYIGTYAVDLLNRFFMAGLIISYLLLIVFGFSAVDPGKLIFSNWKLSFFALPVMIISFGYHNLIPSIATYLKRDSQKIVKAIIIGSLIPLFVYLIWEWLVLGIIPADHFVKAEKEGIMVTTMLHEIVGSSWIVKWAEYFAFFAIVTSFVGVALSFVDFLTDGLQLKKNKSNRLLICFAALLPPFIFSLVHPHVFLAALEYAGGFGATLLFGILPTLMVYFGRKQGWKTRIVPGDNGMLFIILALSGFIFAIEFIQAFQRGSPS